MAKGKRKGASDRMGEKYVELKKSLCHCNAFCILYLPLPPPHKTPQETRNDMHCTCSLELCRHLSVVVFWHLNVSWWWVEGAQSNSVENEVTSPVCKREIVLRSDDNG